MRYVLEGAMISDAEPRAMGSSGVNAKRQGWMSRWEGLLMRREGEVDDSSPSSALRRRRSPAGLSSCGSWRMERGGWRSEEVMVTWRGRFDAPSWTLSSVSHAGKEVECQSGSRARRSQRENEPLISAIGMQPKRHTTILHSTSAFSATDLAILQTTLTLAMSPAAPAGIRTSFGIDLHVSPFSSMHTATIHSRPGSPGTAVIEVYPTWRILWR